MTDNTQWTSEADYARWRAGQIKEWDRVAVEQGGNPEPRPVEAKPEGRPRWWHFFKKPAKDRSPI